VKEISLSPPAMTKKSPQSPAQKGIDVQKQIPENTPMRLEPLQNPKPVKSHKLKMIRIVALYLVGTAALIATVLFLLETEERQEFTPQFGTLEAQR
jgi:hypothetical protein